MFFTINAKLNVLPVAWLLTLSLAFPQLLSANPFQATMGGYTRGFLHQEESKPQFRININTPEGLHEIELERKSFAQSSDVELFQGRLRDKKWARGFSGVSADIINSRLRVIFHGRRTNRLYTYTTELPKNIPPGQKLKLKASSHNRFRQFPCANAAHSQSSDNFAPLNHAPSSGDPVYNPPRVINIATDSDYEFFLKHGSTAMAESRAILNTAEAIYASQLGIRFNIVSQNVFESEEQPYTSSVAPVLLSQFRSFTNTENHLGEADIYHLFTGKDLVTSQGAGIVGVAFIGTACQPDNFSFSVTQNTDASIQALVAAHEIGHNLNARHPEETLLNPPPSLMSGNVQPGNTQFSDFSLGEIVSYIDQYGECLEEVLPEVRLVTSLINNRRFRATIRVIDNYAETCTATLYASAHRQRIKNNPETAQLLTTREVAANRLGLRARMRLGTRNERRIYFRAIAQCGELEMHSNIRSLRPLLLRDGRLGTRRWIHNLQRRLNSN